MSQQSLTLTSEMELATDEMKNYDWRSNEREKTETGQNTLPNYFPSFDSRRRTKPRHSKTRAGFAAPLCFHPVAS